MKTIKSTIRSLIIGSLVIFFIACNLDEEPLDFYGFTNSNWEKLEEVLSKQDLQLEENL